MSDKRRAGRTTLVAYGKTVWSRHPLLVPSRAEAKSTQPSLISLNPLGRLRTYVGCREGERTRFAPKGSSSPRCAPQACMAERCGGEKP